MIKIETLLLFFCLEKFDISKFMLYDEILHKSSIEHTIWIGEMNMNEMIVRTEEDLQRAVEICPDKIIFKDEMAEVVKKTISQKN